MISPRLHHFGIFYQMIPLFGLQRMVKNSHLSHSPVLSRWAMGSRSAGLRVAALLPKSGGRGYLRGHVAGHGGMIQKRIRGR